MIALSAKMAKADGIVTDDEIETFQRLFRVPPRRSSQCAPHLPPGAPRHRRLRGLCRARSRGCSRGNPALLEDILDGLFEIAKADGVLHPGEPRSWSASPRSSASRRTSSAASAPAISRPTRPIPMSILGVAYDASDDEIKHTYRMLVRENHPDSLIGRGVPEEFVRLATDKLAAINVAYDRIEAERGIKVSPATH